jgi:hypothetical protein
MDFRESLLGQIEKARRAMIESKTRYDTLASMLADFDARSNGNHHIKPNAEEKIQPNTDQTQNISAYVRKLITDNESSGISTSDLISQVKAIGADVADTYIYSIVSRLRKKGLIETRADKHFPREGTQHERVLH